MQTSKCVPIQTDCEISQGFPRSVNTTSTKNKFVQLAIERVLLLALEVKSAASLREQLAAGYDIVIVGDNDFYSQRAQASPLFSGTFQCANRHGQLAAKNLQPTLENLLHLPPFLSTGVKLAEVHKTGLGSSAALITSLVSALLLHLGVIPEDSFKSEGGLESASEGRKLAHNTAQYIHCLAQGKVGSGFDVSSAVFGSQLYTRFDPQVIQPLMEDNLVCSN